MNSDPENSKVPKEHDPKATNPKDIIGSSKLPLDLIPATLAAWDCLGYLEGAAKYGRYNWRIAGVRASIYIAAEKRHMAKYEGGEWADPKTKVPHLVSARACLGIILDAFTCGKLVDDRPPVAPQGELEEANTVIAAHLREMFKDHKPHQYTIADSAPAPDAGAEVYEATQALCKAATRAGLQVAIKVSKPSSRGNVAAKRRQATLRKLAKR